MSKSKFFYVTIITSLLSSNSFALDTSNPKIKDTDESVACNKAINISPDTKELEKLKEHAEGRILELPVQEESHVQKRLSELSGQSKLGDGFLSEFYDRRSERGFND